jgi:hypothetical protein
METEPLPLDDVEPLSEDEEEEIMTRNGVPQIITLPPLERAEIIWGKASLISEQWTQFIELT